MHPFDTTGREARYVIGVDLGTTNTAVAYVDLAQQPEDGSPRRIQFFEVPQLVGPGEFGHRPTLPSSLYLPGAYDLPDGSTALPWDPDRDYAVGELAREQGARVPGRLVTSAKSWLCHSGVDRTAPILPWGAPDEVSKVSPVEASARFLQHIREAWNEQMGDGQEAHRFERQHIVLTVPASFDEVARELTVTAAQEAGLPHVILLEEPLAAFYAWLSDHDATQDQMQDGQLILVCDVGGGTTDFSIVGIRRGDEGPRFERLAVGDHLMLGGDNMDNALGRKMEVDLVGGPSTLEVQRWHQLVHQCRRAKEQLLAGEQETVAISVVGAGGKLIADTLKGELRRQDVQQLVLDGFFPEVSLDEPLAEGQRAGLTELGLPYEHDPAITRHLADFWRHAQPYLQEQTGRTDPYPDFVLFNGGVFTPASLRERLVEIVRQWFTSTAGADWSPAELTNARLDLAVAVGAAYYGQVRLGEGIRVGSGSARSYYVGVEATADADDDVQPAVCLVPRGVEEGFEGHLTQMEVEALANQPVTFHLFSSSTRSGDALGEVVQLHDDEVSALPPIRTVLRFGKRVARKIPVQLAVRLTEVGTLELWCQSVHTEHRWRLRFDVRSEPESDAEAPPLEDLIDPAQVESAQAIVTRMFEGEASIEPDARWEELESVFNHPRAEWPMPLLRKLADALLDVPRDRSPWHEVLWFDLLGYCLRPGFGDSVDDWRMQQAWIVHLKGLHFPQKRDNRLAWWCFWRRVGAGLSAEKQAQIYYEARPFIQLQVRTKKDHRVYPRRMDKLEKREAWMTLATFERLPPDIKITLGQLILDKFKKARPSKDELWALSRLGARHPAYGPLDSLVPGEEVDHWLHTLLTMHLPKRETVAYTLVHLARYTGDRSRDVPEATRHRVHRWLRKMPDEEHFRELLTNPESKPSHEGQDWFIGEAPPEDARALLDPHGITFTVSSEG